MVRSALADETLLPYLQNLAVPDVCTIGLILGQPTPTKDYIIHFAKTPPLQSSDKSKKIELSTKPSKTLNEISDSWVAEHAKHATRMLPGGMYILGVFVVSSEDLLNPFAAKFRSILSSVHKQLASNEYIYGNPDTPEKLVLNYCTATKSFSCKSYNVVTSSVKPAEMKFLPNATKWTCLECKYDLDQTFPMYEGKVGWSLKRHLQDILETINKDFKSTVYLFDHEIKDEDETLESMGKKKKGIKMKNVSKDSDNKSVEISVFVPCESVNTADVEIKPCGGFVRIMGQVWSKLWMQPGQTIAAASRAISEDIVRSLASRLEMHWDSLIDEESGSSEDVNSLHEPPRRVFISLPDAAGVMMCDYLFPGEGGNEALISLHELMDIAHEMDSHDIVDAEGQPDLNDLYPRGEDASLCSSDETTNSNSSPTEAQFNAPWRMSFAIALIVLLLSLLYRIMFV